MVSICLAMISDGAEQVLFLALYAEYETMVYQVALAVLADPALVEDAVQESWLRVAISFYRIRKLNADSVKGYLSSLVKNVCLDMNGKKNEIVEEALPEDWHAPDPSRYTDVLDLVTERIREMPVQYREILERKYILGYTNREIAHALKINESTVASRVMRGRALLADMLRKEGFNEAGLDI